MCRISYTFSLILLLVLKTNGQQYFGIYIIPIHNNSVVHSHFIHSNAVIPHQHTWALSSLTLILCWIFLSPARQFCYKTRAKSFVAPQVLKRHRVVQDVTTNLTIRHATHVAHDSVVVPLDRECVSLLILNELSLRLL